MEHVYCADIALQPCTPWDVLERVYCCSGISIWAAGVIWILGRVPHCCQLLLPLLRMAKDKHHHKMLHACVCDCMFE